MTTPLSSSELAMLESIHAQHADLTAKTKAMIEKVMMAMLCMSRASWEQGVAAQALYEFHCAFRSDYGPEYFVCMAHDAVVRQGDDGRLSARLCQGDQGSVDTTAILETLIHAHEVTSEDYYLDASKRAIDYLLHKTPRTSDGIWSHLAGKVQLWVDAIYMGPPGLAAAGSLWYNEGYIREAYRQTMAYVKVLWDEDEHLFSHIYDPGKGEYIRQAFWGVGNGWAIAGMARVLDFLPPDWEPERDALLSVIIRTITAMLRHIRSDHLFHDVLNDPSTFVETNAAQQLSYTILRLCRKGHLRGNPCERDWRMEALRMRDAVWLKVDRWGLVQGVCGSPSFDHPGTAAEGQAFFLLMEAEYEHYDQL
ncbi:Six-hairpin glycosidase [Gloeophyllum trabeum ATCC 11539]|uniref:Six-hairpin glycosidase n=1 Tax=Gloeophyllum trabeum (strain ATCC 11539 / FP-39264 / Madison 617) TaxID=670483 RepID=S7Q7R5_GLOTA|nr:Six-hairpin glycosidase [Gloeophyllum trabeum ATCC 11539]EPQ55572.1 Six-hairpin glycosidase [Gloeophyllum trabeum ATCC 11539]